MIDFISGLNGYLWGFPMIAFLFSTHIFMTGKTRGIQRKLLKGIRLSVTRPEGDAGEISPFEALSTSLASTLGTGNIIGVASAVAMGGAGAVFWCWITGILGMATQYSEVVLSVKYRVKNSKGELVGGPMYSLIRGVKSRPLGLLYAFAAALGGLITGSVIQSNAIFSVFSQGAFSERVKFNFFGINISLTALIVGVSAAVLTSMVIFGGIGFISKICRYLVPFMAAVFMLACAAVLFINRSFLGEAIGRIFRDAFLPRGAGGGFVGSTILVAARFGVARGLFSNEAGLGTSSIVSASANTPNPVRQALVSMTATFWDTVVMCFVTGLVIVSSIVAAEGSVDYVDSASACYLAFSRIPYIGGAVLTFSMTVFAFSTIIGLSCVGANCVTCVFGVKAVAPYRILWVVGVFIAPMVPLDVLWSVADLCNATLAVPNVLSLFMLRNVVKEESEKYLENLDMLAEV